MALTRELKDQVLALPPDEREVLKILIDNSLENEAVDRSISQAWIEEIERRVEAIERGEMEVYEADEIIARMRAKFPP